MALAFNKKEEGTKKIFNLTGRMDSNTAPEFESFLKDNLVGTTDLVLNFEKLQYISSAGLRVVLSAQKIMNKQGKMEITNVNDVVGEVFEATGLAEILTII